MTQGELRIDFVPEVEFPCIAAIEVDRRAASRARSIAAGRSIRTTPRTRIPETLPRDLPVADFYADWATAQFGPEVGPAAAAIFTKLDGNFPQTSGWIRGPGAIVVNKQPWAAWRPGLRSWMSSPRCARRSRHRKPGTIRLVAEHIPRHEVHGRARLRPR